MLIGKRFKIESDALNVTLSKLVVRHPKEKPSYKEWEVIGYYSSVANALKGLVGHGIRESELKDLVTINKKIEELYATVKSVRGKQ